MTLRRVILCLALGAQAFVRPAQRLALGRRAPALRAAMSMSLAAASAEGRHRRRDGCSRRRSSAPRTARLPRRGLADLFGSKGGKSVNTKQWGTLTTAGFSVEATRAMMLFSWRHPETSPSSTRREIGEGLSENGVVVDNSSALRYDDDVPLVVPEVNGQLCEGNKVIANPNCTTAIALMALFPLFLAFGLKKVIVTIKPRRAPARPAWPSSRRASPTRCRAMPTSRTTEGFGSKPIANT